MNAHDLMTDDGRALLALCSSLGFDEEHPQVEAAPFTLSEWNKLARKIQSSALGQPAALFGRSTRELAEALMVAPSEAERIERLLDRRGCVEDKVRTLLSHGIFTVTRADGSYPDKLRRTLKHQSPTVLFGAGEIDLLARGGIAIVGSRNIDGAGAAFARCLGRRCAEGRIPVVSGGARGTDRVAMEAAIEAGGTAFGVLADSLERAIRQPDLHPLLSEGRLVLLTPYAPDAGFSVGAAMGRNKVVYGLADYAVVVGADLEKGGTWAGAVEALKAGWCPVFVRAGKDVPKGNLQLLERHAVALDESVPANVPDLSEWLREHGTPRHAQPELFPRL